MRIPVMTINGTRPIEITATVENGTKEYLSGNVVTGVALYVEQPDSSGQGFLAMSLLIPDCRERKTEGAASKRRSQDITILRNYGFAESDARKIVSKLSGLQEEILDYVYERSRRSGRCGFRGI